MNNSTTTSKRVQFIDVAKGLGILLVVLGHNPLLSDTEGNAFKIVFSFHVPLFFFLSGLFFNSSVNLVPLSIQKFDSLLKPYLVTSILLVIAIPRNTSALWNYIFGVFYGNGSTLIWPPLWFLPHLWCLFIYSFFFVRITKFNCLNNFHKIGLLVLMSWLGSSLFQMLYGSHENLLKLKIFGQIFAPLWLPFSIDLLPITSFYFLLGYWFKEKILEMKKVPILLLFLASLIFIGCHLFFDFSTDINLRAYDFPISSFAGISGIFILLCISIFLSRITFISHLLTYVGSASIFILIFHAYLQNKAFLILVSLMGEQYFLTCGIAFLIGCSIPILFWFIVKKNSYLSPFWLPIKSKQL